MFSCCAISDITINQEKKAVTCNAKAFRSAWSAFLAKTIFSRGYRGVHKYLWKFRRDGWGGAIFVLKKEIPERREAYMKFLP